MIVFFCAITGIAKMMTNIRTTSTDFIIRFDIKYAALHAGGFFFATLRLCGNISVENSMRLSIEEGFPQSRKVAKKKSLAARIFVDKCREFSNRTVPAKPQRKNLLHINIFPGFRIP